MNIHVLLGLQSLSSCPGILVHPPNFPGSSPQFSSRAGHLLEDSVGWQTSSEPGPIRQVQDDLEQLMAAWIGKSMGIAAVLGIWNGRTLGPWVIQNIYIYIYIIFKKHVMVHVFENHPTHLFKNILDEVSSCYLASGKSTCSIGKSSVKCRLSHLDLPARQIGHGIQRRKLGDFMSFVAAPCACYSKLEWSTLFSTTMFSHVLSK